MVGQGPGHGAHAQFAPRPAGDEVDVVVVPHGSKQRPPHAGVAASERVLPGVVAWKFVVALDKTQVLAQQVARSNVSDTAALNLMAKLARDYAYAPSTQGKGKSVTVFGLRWNGSTWQSFSTDALVAHQG